LVVADEGIEVVKFPAHFGSGGDISGVSKTSVAISSKAV
jgi:hypothetical protein